MTSLISVTQAQPNEYTDVKNDLCKRFNVTHLSDINKSELFEDYLKSPGYAHYKAFGRIKEDLELTELELAILVDSGHSFFGGYSRIYNDRTFEVKIYTD